MLVRALETPLFVLFGVLAATASATGQGLAEEVRPAPLPPPPQIQSVSPISAMAQPAEVHLGGTGLEHIREVRIAGRPAQVVRQTATELWVLPHPLAPGFHDVLATGLAGMVSAGRLEVWPSLRTEVTRTPADAHGAQRAGASQVRAEALHVQIANGDDGFYALGASPELRRHPLMLMRPLTGYVLWLNDPWLVLSAGIFPSARPLHLSFKVPPGLQGRSLELQAWCQQRCAPSSVTRCFSNVSSARM